MLAFEGATCVSDIFFHTQQASSVEQSDSSFWSTKAAWLIFVLAETRAVIWHSTDTLQIFMALSPCQIKSIFWLHFVLAGCDAVEMILTTVRFKRLKGIHCFLPSVQLGRVASHSQPLPATGVPRDQPTSSTSQGNCRAPRPPPLNLLYKGKIIHSELLETCILAGKESGEGSREIFKKRTRE